MANQLCIEKSEPSKTRRLPFLPRIGLFIDIAGRQITYRQVPITETLLNLRDVGFSMANLMKVAAKQFNEIKFPNATASCESAPKKRTPLTSK